MALIDISEHVPRVLKIQSSLIINLDINLGINLGLAYTLNFKYMTAINFLRACF